jgi:hypothetical protein
MSETSDYEDLRLYLLGQQPEEVADRLERRLLLDEDLFELAEAAEAELLDECARGELAPALCEQLTRRLAASPGGRVRLAQARGLAKAIAAPVANIANAANAANSARPAPAPVRPFRRPGLLSRPAVRVALAAGLAGLIVTAWQVERTLQPRPSEILVQAAPPAVFRGTTPAPAPAMPPMPQMPPTSPKTPPSTPPQAEPPSGPALPSMPAEKPRAKRFPAAVLVLQVAMTTRGGEEDSPDVLHIVSPDQPVELQLELDEGETYPSYTVSIDREEDGRGVWTRSVLRPTSGSVLKIRPRASALAAGSYRVTLTGVTPERASEAVGYRFRVERP